VRGRVYLTDSKERRLVKLIGEAYSNQRRSLVKIEKLAKRAL